MSEKKVSIQISESIVNKVQEKVENSAGEYSGIEDYIEFILREILSDDDENTFSPEDEKKVMERLKKLGYI